MSSLVDAWGRGATPCGASTAADGGWGARAERVRAKERGDDVGALTAALYLSSDADAARRAALARNVTIVPPIQCRPPSPHSGYIISRGLARVTSCTAAAAAAAAAANGMYACVQVPPRGVVGAWGVRLGGRGAARAAHLRARMGGHSPTNTWIGWKGRQRAACLTRAGCGWGRCSWARAAAHFPRRSWRSALGVESRWVRTTSCREGVAGSRCKAG